MSEVRRFFPCRSLRDQRSTLMHDSKAMELILTCWTHMSTPNRGDVSALIHSLYMDQCGCRPCYVDPASDRHARAVHIIGVDTLIGKFEDWLTVRTPLRLARPFDVDGVRVVRTFALWTRHFFSSFILSKTSFQTTHRTAKTLLQQRYGEMLSRPCSDRRSMETPSRVGIYTIWASPSLGEISLY